MKTKRIVIPHNGPIYPKGGVYGPINTPYVEQVRTIGVLLLNNYPVEEVLDNGERVKLTLQNYDKDNSAKKEAEKVSKETTSNTSDKREVNNFNKNRDDRRNNRNQFNNRNKPQQQNQQPQQEKKNEEPVVDELEEK
jgi:hypothetical protein